MGKVLEKALQVQKETRWSDTFTRVGWIIKLTIAVKLPMLQSTTDRLENSLINNSVYFRYYQPQIRWSSGIFSYEQIELYRTFDDANGCYYSNRVENRSTSLCCYWYVFGWICCFDRLLFNCNCHLYLLRGWTKCQYLTVQSSVSGRGRRHKISYAKSCRHFAASDTVL